MSAIDSQMLAAWEVARTTKGDSVTFAQRSAPSYDVTTGANTDTASSDTVTGIICPVDKAMMHQFDAAGDVIDLSVQVKRSELTQAPTPGDRVTVDGVVYELVSATPFTFGVTECNLRGVR